MAVVLRVPLRPLLQQIRPRPAVQYAFLTSDSGQKIPPKRPANGYALFMKEKHPLIKQQNPGISLGDISKKVSESWRQLSPTEKQGYQAVYLTRKNAYEKEMAKFKEQLSEEEMGQLKKDQELKKRKLALRRKKQLESRLGKPKKPLSAFYLYMATLNRGNLSVSEFAKECALKWNALPVAEKEAFSKQADAAMSSYRKDLNIWEEKIKDQHPELVRGYVSPAKERMEEKRRTMARKRTKRRLRFYERKKKLALKIQEQKKRARQRESERAKRRKLQAKEKARKTRQRALQLERNRKARDKKAKAMESRKMKKKEQEKKKKQKEQEKMKKAKEMEKKKIQKAKEMEKRQMQKAKEMEKKEKLKAKEQEIKEKLKAKEQEMKQKPKTK